MCSIGLILAVVNHSRNFNRHLNRNQVNAIHFHPSSPGGSKPNQIKFNIRAYRAGSELPQSWGDFESRIAITRREA